MRLIKRRFLISFILRRIFNKENKAFSKPLSILRNIDIRTDKIVQIKD